jgi:hypothetical protein
MYGDERIAAPPRRTAVATGGETVARRLSDAVSRAAPRAGRSELATPTHHSGSRWVPQGGTDGGRWRRIVWHWGEAAAWPASTSWMADARHAPSRSLGVVLVNGEEVAARPARTAPALYY